jgi:putative ABC transport system substrate-binding protein
MRRRDFIKGIAVSTTWSLAARAQQYEQMRRVAVLAGQAEDDLDMQARLNGFRQGLQLLGWSEGRNLRIDYRFAAGRADYFQSLAKEVVALQPEVIFAQSTAAAVALQRESRTVPFVFVNVSDPIGSGLIASLAQPGGNLTGVLQYEDSVTGKWLGMLKEISPALTRAALVASPKTTPYDYFLRAAVALAPSFAIDVVASRVEDATNIERAIASFASVPNIKLTGAHVHTTSPQYQTLFDRLARSAPRQ